MSLCLEYAHWCSPSSSHLLIRPSKSIHPFGGRGRPNHFLRTSVRCGLHLMYHAISKIQRTANHHRLREPQNHKTWRPAFAFISNFKPFLKLGFARIISCLHQPLRPIRVPRVPSHRRPFRHAVEVSQWYDDAPGHNPLDKKCGRKKSRMNPLSSMFSDLEFGIAMAAVRTSLGEGYNKRLSKSNWHNLY